MFIKRTEFAPDMIGKTIVYNGERGTVTGKYNDEDSVVRVWAIWEDGREMHIDLESVCFVEGDETTPTQITINGVLYNLTPA